MSVRALVIGALLASPAISAADVPLYGIVKAPPRADGRTSARQVLPVPNTVDFERATDLVEAPALAQSRIVYLNKNGVTLSPGDNDARANRSTVVSAQTAIAGWNVSATNWQATVSCMRELFAAYDVQIVEADPGNVPHIEAVFGGTPTQIGMDANVAGVSPFTLDCSVIENSVVFTFTNAFVFTPREACETMAQEIAHSFGLDHVLLASDPMTYLPYNGNRAFRDQTATCGEDSAAPRACGINGSVCRPTQNSVQLLRERLGPKISAPPPEVDEPVDGDVVGGCTAGGGTGSALFGLGLFAALTARRRRR